MMNEMKIFQSPEFGAIRTMRNGQDEPMFCAKDVCSVLGYMNGRDAVKNHVEPEDVEKIYTPTNGGKQRMLYVNESGLYALVLFSKLECARRFKHWVTSEVLPSIRKTGTYSIPRTYAEALQLAANQAKELEMAKPKVEFYDKVTGSSDTCEMKEVAKILNFKNIGRNTLFEILREEKVLDRQNQPYQKYVDAGYFRIVESKWEDKDGDIHINLKTVVFQKGVDFIRKTVLKSDKYLSDVKVIADAADKWSEKNL